MFKNIRNSFQRKLARRFTKVYPAVVESFHLEEEGMIEFANWNNPLAKPIVLKQTDINFFKKFIKKGDLVIDIGANIGDTTVPMAIAAGKSGLTLAFDPNPYLYNVLNQNSKLNKELTNIIPFPYAISSTDETYYFTSSEASFANGAISKEKTNRHGKFVHKEKVKGINLETFLNKEYRNWVEKLSFIKIDTEGYDKEIIKSISSLIETCRPVIVAESFGKNTNDEKIELYEVIQKHNYSIHWFYDFYENTDEIKLENKNEMTQWKKNVNIYGLPL